MESQHRRLLTPALVVIARLALLLVVIALTRSGSSNDSAAIAFPVVLAGLAVASVVGMFVWKAVSKKADHR